MHCLLNRGFRVVGRGHLETFPFFSSGSATVSIPFSRTLVHRISKGIISSRLTLFGRLYVPEGHSEEWEHCCAQQFALQSIDSPWPTVLQTWDANREQRKGCMKGMHLSLQLQRVVLRSLRDIFCSLQFISSPHSMVPAFGFAFGSPLVLSIFQLNKFCLCASDCFALAIYFSPQTEAQGTLFLCMTPL